MREVKTTNLQPGDIRVESRKHALALDQVVTVTTTEDYVAVECEGIVYYPDGTHERDAVTWQFSEDLVHNVI